MKALLVATAWIEVIAGVAAIAFPSQAVELLLGTRLESATSLTLTRVAGAALIALALVCWNAHRDPSDPATRIVIGAMLFYNAAIVAILLFARFADGLAGPGFWPTIVLHVFMAGWLLCRIRTS